MNDDEQIPTVWVRSIRWHTKAGAGPQPEGSFYLIREDEVENIVHVLKFAVLDVAPPRAVRRAEPEDV